MVTAVREKMEAVGGTRGEIGMIVVAKRNGGVANRGIESFPDRTDHGFSQDPRNQHP